MQSKVLDFSFRTRRHGKYITVDRFIYAAAGFQTHDFKVDRQDACMAQRLPAQAVRNGYQFIYTYFY